MGSTTTPTKSHHHHSDSIKMPPKAGKKAAPAPFPQPKAGAGSKKAPKNPLIEKRTRNYGIGQDIQPRRNLSRMVKWPEYVRLQRQKKILNLRLKVPPAIAQFQNVLDKNTAAQAFKLLNKYCPESKTEKKERLVKEATAIKEGKKKEDVSKKPYAAIKGKARLGTVVHKKTAAVLALTEVRSEDKSELSKLVSAVKDDFMENHENARRQWGGGIMGAKAQMKIHKKQKALEAATKI